MKKLTIAIVAFFLISTGILCTENTPVALSIAFDSLGLGATGTVMGIIIEVAPEDRERLGERVRVVTTLILEDDLIDRQTAVVSLAGDGTVMLYREWPVGAYELRAGISSIDGDCKGVWLGDIVVPDASETFIAPDEAPPDAIALAITPAREGYVRFKPPPEIGGIGAVQLEIEAPEATAQVEFFQNEESLGQRNRPPWTVSVPLGDIINRSRVRAIARDKKGQFLGEDALVLNNPSGQIGVAILIAPETSDHDGLRTVTVSVTSTTNLHEISLHLGNHPVARWAKCPCVIDIPVPDLEAASIIAAEAIDEKGNRGDAVTTNEGGTNFIGQIKVELVELPITVFDENSNPITGLGPDAFVILEDGVEVSIEGFGTVKDLSLSLALAVDISGSMTEIFPDVRRAIVEFAKSLLQTGDETMLLTFAWDAKIEVPWTDDKNMISTRLERVIPEGGTSLHDVVVRALEQFRGRRGRQALVLLTDGEDTTSRTDWHTAERFAHTMRIPLFPIGLGVGRLAMGARSTLKDLANESGGEAFFPKKVEELEATYNRIGELLRSQYLVWYTSTSAKEAHEFRTIEVRLKDPKYRIRTIRGYYPGR